MSTTSVSAPLLLSPAALASRLGVSVRTIANWRAHEGLPVVCIGGANHYRLAAVEAWLREREHVTTQAEGGVAR